jgi:hypothetical protein
VRVVGNRKEGLLFRKKEAKNFFPWGACLRWPVCRASNMRIRGGLTNIGYCPQGTQIVEFLDRTYVN